MDVEISSRTIINNGITTAYVFFIGCVVIMIIKRFSLLIFVFLFINLHCSEDIVLTFVDINIPHNGDRENHFLIAVQEGNRFWEITSDQCVNKKNIILLLRQFAIDANFFTFDAYWKNILRQEPLLLNYINTDSSIDTFDFLNGCAISINNHAAKLSDLSYVSHVGDKEFHANYDRAKVKPSSVYELYKKLCIEHNRQQNVNRVSQKQVNQQTMLLIGLPAFFYFLVFVNTIAKIVL